jgi:hypothetical protein
MLQWRYKLKKLSVKRNYWEAKIKVPQCGGYVQELIVPHCVFELDGENVKILTKH